MTHPDLVNQLNYQKAYRENRLKAAQWVLAHPHTFRQLLTYCFEDPTELSYKAAWAFEFVYLEEPALLYPHFQYFFNKLPSVKMDQILRPMAHVCEMICIKYYKKQEPAIREHFSKENKNTLTECAFDWLITDQKVACQVRAMTCLYYLGTEFNWIHPELKQILESNIHKGSAGYKSRARKTLEQISR
ncbi:MAG: hypothetical protein DWP94_06430 [Flavobacterium sp.]|nr:MAG: hypothetical protein DWP94_06430 [Flavobacterium sp.]